MIFRFHQTSQSFKEHLQQANFSMLALTVVTACRPQWFFSSQTEMGPTLT